MHKILKQNRLVEIIERYRFVEFLFGVVFDRGQCYLPRKLELERIIKEPLEISHIHCIRQGNLQLLRLSNLIFCRAYKDSVQLITNRTEREKFVIGAGFVQRNLAFLKGSTIRAGAFANKELQIPNHRRREKFFVFFQVPVDITDMETFGSAHQLAQEGIAILVDRSIVTRPASRLRTQIHRIRFLLPGEHARIRPDKEDMPCRNNPVDRESHKCKATAEKPRITRARIFTGTRKHLADNFPRNKRGSRIKLEFHQVNRILNLLPNFLFDRKAVFFGIQAHPMRQMCFQQGKRIGLSLLNALCRETNPAIEFIDAVDKLQREIAIGRFNIFVRQVTFMGRGKRSIGHLRKEHLVNATAPIIFTGVAVNVHVHHPFFPSSHIAIGNLQCRLHYRILDKVKERRPRNGTLLMDIQKVRNSLADQGIFFRIIRNRIRNVEFAITRSRIEHLFNRGPVRIKIRGDDHHFVETHALF